MKFTFLYHAVLDDNNRVDYKKLIALSCGWTCCLALFIDLLSKRTLTPSTDIITAVVTIGMGAMGAGAFIKGQALKAGAVVKDLPTDQDKT